MLQTAEKVRIRDDRMLGVVLSNHNIPHAQARIRISAWFKTHHTHKGLLDVVHDVIGDVLGTRYIYLVVVYLLFVTTNIWYS